MLQLHSENQMRARWLVGSLFVLWLALVFYLGARGMLVTPSGSPPLRILSAVLLPLVLFFTAFRCSRDFRDLVLGVDMRVAAGIQAWRAGGLTFLALYTYGVLPGFFAWPAGLGDIAIGITAPWVLVRLVRQPSFSDSRGFLVWNFLGILDLVIAVSLGALSAVLALGGNQASPLAQLPLVLIPAYLVPIFVMLHLAALFQARHIL